MYSRDELNNLHNEAQEDGMDLDIEDDGFPEDFEDDGQPLEFEEWRDFDRYC